jgi:hypothetical protein
LDPREFRRVFPWGNSTAEELASYEERTYFAYAIIMSGETSNRVGPECLGFTARLLSRVITAVYDDALADVGLKVS